MKAMLLYIAFVVVGGFVAFFLGRFAEYEFGPTVSLIVFLALFFTNFGVSWIAVILCIDGNLKNAQGAIEQREFERAHRASLQNAKGSMA